MDWKWIEDLMLASSDEDSVEEMQYAESSTLRESQLRAKESILKQREQKRLAENSKEVEVIEIDPEAAHNEGQAAPSNIASGEGAADEDEGEVHGEEVDDTSTGQMKYPKAGEAIQFRERGVWQNAQVLGRGGKASSRLHAGYFNLMVDSQKIGVYLDRVEWRRVDQSEDENIPQRKKYAALVPVDLEVATRSVMAHRNTSRKEERDRFFRAMEAKYKEEEDGGDPAETDAELEMRLDEQRSAGEVALQDLMDCFAERQENGEGGEEVDLEGESTSSEGTTEDETFDDEF